MSVSIATALDVSYAVNPFEHPLGVSAGVARFLSPRLSSAVKINLELLPSLRSPFLHLPGVFKADKFLCPTPRGPRDSSLIETYPSLSVALGLLGNAGLKPVSFLAEHGGDIAVHLTPLPQDHFNKLSYEKSRKSLRGHTDASYSPTPREFFLGDRSLSPSPDFVVLTCLRNPGNVPTRLCLLREVLREMAHEDILELVQPYFFRSPQRSFDLAPSSVRVGPVLWSGTDNIPNCRYSHSHVWADPDTHPRAARALDIFGALVSEKSRDIILSPGDILIINNRTVVHGRGEVGADWAPDARWLMRLYANRITTPILPANPEAPWVGG